jgi:hypothetical protein
MDMDRTTKRATPAVTAARSVGGALRRVTKVLFALWLMLASSFVVQAAEPVSGRADSEHSPTAPSDRSLETEPNKKRQNAPAPTAESHSSTTLQRTEALAPAAANRAGGGERSLGTQQQISSRVGQPKSATKPNVHPPVLNNTAVSTKEALAPKKRQLPQHTAMVQTPSANVLTSMAEGFHGRVPGTASLGGPSASAQHNSPLPGLNGTATKHKP